MSLLFFPLEERKEILKEVVAKAQELGFLRQQSDEAIVQLAESEINFRAMRMKFLKEICDAELERLVRDFILFLKEYFFLEKYRNQSRYSSFRQNFIPPEVKGI